LQAVALQPSNPGVSGHQTSSQLIKCIAKDATMAMIMFLDVQAANKASNQVNKPSLLRKKTREGQISLLKPDEPR